MFYEFELHVVDSLLCSVPFRHVMLFLPGHLIFLTQLIPTTGSNSTPTNADGLHENEDDPLVLGPSPI